MHRALVVTLGFLLAGCLDPATGPARETPPTTSHRFYEPVAAIDGCRSGTCYEPTVAADPQGRLFTADGATGPVAISEDAGRTWRHVLPPSMPSGVTGFQSDVLVQVAPSGRLYWSALVIAQPLGRGFVLEGIQIAWLDEGGTTWAAVRHLNPATSVAQVLAPDRQWLGFAPDGTIYLTYNQIPTGIWIAKSKDGGGTWSGWTRAAPLEERGGGIGQSGPPVVDSSGRVFVPACDTAESATRVFASTDGAQTFKSVVVPGGCSWFPILSVGPDDSVVLGVQPEVPLVGISTDHGSSFTTKAWGGPATSSPWPINRGDGSILLAWFRNNATGADLVVSRGNADGAVETVHVATVTGSSNANTPAQTDFASAALLPDGRVATAFADGGQVMVAVEPHRQGQAGSNLLTVEGSDV